ncbi:MAG TPA: sugar phosphate isomerase/epimerase [Firmicutes bacterium]|nr:sugar phosphate isomerase/epimerase [Bacillota bacterium]
MKVAMNTVIFQNQPFEEILPLIKDSGYDGVEIAWVPREHPFYWGEDVDVTKVKRICNSIGLEVSSICPFFPQAYDLANTSNKVREQGISYVRNIIDAANELGAKVVVVVPSAVWKQASGSREEEWACCIASLKELGLYASNRGVTLAIEPLIRFLTYFLHRIEQGLRLIEEANVPGLGVMADLFHMNVEERSIEEAIKEAGDKLVHVHLSDSNNRVPGTGHLDFASILRALSSINYAGYVVAELGVEQSEAVEATRETVKYIRAVERKVMER